MRRRRPCRSLQQETDKDPFGIFSEINWLVFRFFCCGSCSIFLSSSTPFFAMSCTVQTKAKGRGLREKAHPKMAPLHYQCRSVSFLALLLISNHVHLASAFPFSISLFFFLFFTLFRSPFQCSLRFSTLFLCLLERSAEECTDVSNVFTVNIVWPCDQ